MTRYSPIIGYLLAWQLLMPVLSYFTTVTWWTAAATVVVFSLLLRTHDWERNSYSICSAVSVLVMSLILATFGLISPSDPVTQLIIVFWIYAQIAFTATTPYPLSIRMPVIIYTLAYIYMIPASLPALLVLPLALIFSAAMCYLAIKWREKTKLLITIYGPPEPPYSFSLATAIVAAVAINISVTLAEYNLPAEVWPSLTSLSLLSLICAWLLCAKDWKKNVLAVTALVLMISQHIVTALAHLPNLDDLKHLSMVLSVAPVMFHTTAPVFRGMRIVITLYAVYSALNRHALVMALANSHMPLCQQHAIIITIDAILTLTLFMMAIHWRRNKISSVGKK